MQSSITIQTNSLAHLSAMPLSYTQGLIISTPHVFKLYGHHVEQFNFPVTTIFLPEGEEAKNLIHVTSCWEEMALKGFDRQSVVIGLGGGSITDVAGFVASCYMRGIDSIYLPTTLMAMVDAAIGGKTGVNFKEFKNYIGTFHFPQHIVIDPTCLRSLPKREFCSGLAEVIKYGMIDSPILFEKLEREIHTIPENTTLLTELIQESVAIKCKIVESDPLNRDRRDILNYGHTFGHALETLTGHKTYLHGEAVAVGMCCAARLSHHMGILKDEFVIKRQNELLKKAGLPTELPAIDIDRLIELMKSDKKSMANKINLILPEKIGKVVRVFDVDTNLIQQSLFDDERIRGLTTTDTSSSTRTN